MDQLNTFVTRVNDQTGDIIAASDSLNRLLGQFAEQKPVLDKGLDTIPDALAVVNRERENLIDAVDQLGKFSALAADSVNKTKAPLVQELKDLGPVLESLANAGPALTHALDLIPTFPFPKSTLTKWFRGDYANVSLVVDLTLSRIDSSIFTGTRWECDLTWLEMQWGRTIGQLPSPCTNSAPPNGAGNPYWRPTATTRDRNRVSQQAGQTPTVGLLRRRSRRRRHDGHRIPRPAQGAVRNRPLPGDGEPAIVWGCTKTATSPTAG